MTNGIGHNVGGERLLAFINRLENVQSEIDDSNADKREIYAEAKGDGFNVQAIKDVIKERRKNPADRAEQLEMFALYWESVGGRPARAPASQPDNDSAGRLKADGETSDPPDTDHEAVSSADPSDGVLFGSSSGGETAGTPPPDGPSPSQEVTPANPPEGDGPTSGGDSDWSKDLQLHEFMCPVCKTVMAADSDWLTECGRADCPNGPKAQAPDTVETHKMTLEESIVATTADDEETWTCGDCGWKGLSSMVTDECPDCGSIVEDGPGDFGEIPV